MPAAEVATGITRIESVLGPRPFSQYLVRGERALLVDTGVADTPGEVILPALDGLEPDLVLLTHADVDHFGIGYDADTFAWLRDAMGTDTPVDIRLTGGEVLRLGPELELRVLHLPGHSPGHIGLWEPASRTAIVG